MKTNKSEYELTAIRKLETQGLLNPKHMQTLSVFENRRDKALRHILKKERKIEERKQALEERDLNYQLKMTQKAVDDSKMAEMLRQKNLKELLDKQESERFRIQAEKNEYKIESLNNLLDNEEKRRNQNAEKLKNQVENYKKNYEYEEKLKKYTDFETKMYKKKKRKMEAKLKDIEVRVEAARQAIRERSNNHLEELTKVNKVKLGKEHKSKMEKLIQKLKDEELNYDNMIKELIQHKKEKPKFEQDDDMRINKLERVKLENEKRYLTRKENLMIKFHHNEQVIKERQKEREKFTEELKKKNEEVQIRKDMIKENYLKKLEMRRQELSEKLRIEKEKEDAYKKQKEIILENKYTNQVIDQMKMHYYKELHYNMKINNQTGTEEFDKMTKQLVSIPKED